MRLRRDIPIFLTEREVKRLNAGVKELDFESPVFYLPFLPDELIEARLSDLAGAARGGIGPIIVARRRPIQCHPKASGLPVLRRRTTKWRSRLCDGVQLQTTKTSWA